MSDPRPLAMPDPRPSARARHRARARGMSRAKLAVLSRKKAERQPPPPPSKNRVSDVAESISAQILQGPSLKECTASSSTPTVPHSTTDGSTSTCPTRSEKLLPDVLSLDELLSSLPEEELTTAIPQTVLHNTMDGLSNTFPSSCENLGAHADKSASALQDPDVSFLDDFLDSSSEESITASPRTVPHNTTEGSLLSTSSLGSKIVIQHYANCYQIFYIRMDRSGSYLTYPNVGGPFGSLQEAVHATKCFVDELWRETRRSEHDEFSCANQAMHDCKHYLYGPPKRAPCSPSSKATYDGERYLIQAILDQYNDGHNLSGNHAHEVEDILEKQMLYENNWWYCHFNFTTKQKGASNDPSAGSNLFFAEVSHEQGESTWEVNCCDLIPTKSKGVLCFGCKNNGSPMKHPSDCSAFAGGHLDGWYLPYGCLELSSSDDENDARKNMEDDDEEDDDEEDDNKEETRWPAFNPSWTPMFSPEVDRDLYELLMED